MTEPPQPQVQEDTEAYQRATERGEKEAEIYVASQWKLVWWRFRKHRLAVVGTVVVILIYLIALFAEFVAPFTPDAFDADYTYAPPQRLHFFDEDGLGLYVYGYSTKLNEETLVRTFEVDESRACYELGRKSHRNADFTVSLVPSRSLFPAFLSRF
jgi:peptide/nickel transport system permease protein